MEDMARLALVEQNVKDINKFSNILHELLLFINHILENPHDIELRTIKSDTLKNGLSCQAFTDYLKYVGFEPEQNSVAFPKEQALSKLRMAHAAIERKIGFCCDTPVRSSPGVTLTGMNGLKAKRPKLIPADILKTKNGLLLKVQKLFNDVLQYEDEKLLSEARECMPLVTLQLNALDRMREKQKKIKTGEVKGRDMSFDTALLLELMSWFKNRFFTWVDQPQCSKCGYHTTFHSKRSVQTPTEYCNAEQYMCGRCGKSTLFIRHNDVRQLLRTRSGRCGEWANCFTLMCRALGYDTRYVYDTTDHVWCEVFDYDCNSWIHVDPCEGQMNAPLTYAHGWGKKLSYVLALSLDDLQDVTWRYTTEHKEVLSRRTEVPEGELLSAILSLRAHRHAQLSAARRNYLTRRNLKELVELMMERKPSDYESQGRVSGSRAWRSGRGEEGRKRHTFEFTEAGEVSIQYYSANDEYQICYEDSDKDSISSWVDGAYEINNVFRKIENDWKQVYLAREDGSTTGSVSWRLAVKGELQFTEISISVITAVFGLARVDWSVQFDDEDTLPAQFVGESRLSYSRIFKSVILTARLSGGEGDLSWQHAQLCRQALHDNHHVLSIVATISEL